MFPWVERKVSAYRARGGAWKILVAALVVLTFLIGAAVIWWKRRQAAARAHEAFVATVDARAASDKARDQADDAQAHILVGRAAAAEREATLAADRAVEAQQRYAKDLAAIARVRGWDDVGGPRRPAL